MIYSLQAMMEKDEQIEKLKKELEKVPFVVMNPYQGCGLRKIARSPYFPNHEILSAQHVLFL